MNKADELWEKYEPDMDYVGGGEVAMSKEQFLAALSEYGALVRADAVKVCKTVICDCDMSEHDCVVYDCAAAISKMPLP